MFLKRQQTNYKIIVIDRKVYRQGKTKARGYKRDQERNEILELNGKEIQKIREKGKEIKSRTKKLQKFAPVSYTHLCNTAKKFPFVTIMMILKYQDIWNMF